MASNKVNLGIGLASGMFYTAPASTALPAYPTDATGLSSWELSGAVTADGIVWSTGKDSDPLRNWAKEVERLIASDEGGTVQAPLMYTNQKTLETIFGADNVTVAAATSTVPRAFMAFSWSGVNLISFAIAIFNLLKFINYRHVIRISFKFLNC